MRDHMLGNPHALDYCAPPAPPSKVRYTPLRVRPDAVQQALAAAGDHFETSRLQPLPNGDFSVKPLPNGDFEVVREAPRKFRVGDRVVATHDCEPWYASGDRGVVDQIEPSGSIRVAFAPSQTVAVVGDARSWWCHHEWLRHEGAAL